MVEAQSYRFGSFQVDRRSACLRRGGVTVPLRPKSFDVLVYLAQHPGRLVPKKELIDHVWQNVNVTQNSLVQCIKEVRQALQDDGQAIIETVAKRGYLFALPVTTDAGVADPSASATTVEAGGNNALPLPDRPSIAVLPFANMSGDPNQEYFADGISEDLITGLSRIRWLFVIARNSTFVYKGRAVDVRQVAKEVGVRYVLEGSVRRAGQRLRISAQLVDATTGGHHWAEQYDRELGEIFAVQDEITRSVVAAIEPRLLAAEGVRAFARSPGDLGAWELVARAQTHVWRLTRTDNEAAVEALGRAVDAYPDYAPARSLLGFCLVFAAHNGWIDRDQGLLAGRQHTLRAIALDDCDPWGQIAFGYWAMMERRTEESIAAFRRAVSLNPGSAAAHGYLSHGLAFAGLSDEAITHGREAMRLSPLDPDTAMFLGGIAVASYLAGQYAEACRSSEQLLRLRPGFHGAQRLRCASLAQMGRVDEAKEFLAVARLEQPQLSIDWIKASVPYQTPELMERFLQGMRKAGLTD
ncbi:winged helix-turn-helix domain-containing tetratricopeptide repeat protein [Bradyrhizobium sp.]|uniref:winged helix-turn-helix domain-containing tetratricopeptide repeat protein n=1 Tax=Bradyrhizobium sp. TaxID=376 RepID=UPI0025B8DF1F|nr:winged helix-turn-helix domain-containing tetratricopeptide repeat protein [Bradyrhizobium sp.]